MIGSGGGAEVLSALAHGARHVTAVELDRELVAMVRTLSGVYDDPRVRVVTSEGRRFLSASSEQYDLIQIALVGSHGASAAGVQALTRTLHGLVLTMHNPPGRRMLIVQLSSNDYAFLVFGVLLLGIAWVMVEATRLAREHAEFV